MIYECWYKYTSTFSKYLTLLSRANRHLPRKPSRGKININRCGWWGEMEPPEQIIQRRRYIFVLGRSSVLIAATVNTAVLIPIQNASLCSWPMQAVSVTPIPLYLESAATYVANRRRPTDQELHSVGSSQSETFLYRQVGVRPENNYGVYQTPIVVIYISMITSIKLSSAVYLAVATRWWLNIVMIFHRSNGWVDSDLSRSKGGNLYFKHFIQINNIVSMKQRHIVVLFNTYNKTS